MELQRANETNMEKDMIGKEFKTMYIPLKDIKKYRIHMNQPGLRSKLIHDHCGSKQLTYSKVAQYMILCTLAVIMTNI